MQTRLVGKLCEIKLGSELYVPTPSPQPPPLGRAGDTPCPSEDIREEASGGAPPRLGFPSVNQNAAATGSPRPVANTTSTACSQRVKYSCCRAL